MSLNLDDADGPEVEIGQTNESSLPDTARRALVSLLTNRYIWRDRNRAAWEGITTFEEDVRSRLAEMYLDLVLDPDLGIAFKRQQQGDDVPKLLRRERALSRDASLVMIMLFREFTFADQSDGPVVVTRDQISEFLRAYREEGDANDAAFYRRVDAAINTLVKPWQLLEPDASVDYLFRVAPVIVPLLGVDEFARLEQAYRREAITAGRMAERDSVNDDEGPS